MISETSQSKISRQFFTLNMYSHACKASGAVKNKYNHTAQIVARLVKYGKDSSNNPCSSYKCQQNVEIA